MGRHIFGKIVCLENFYGGFVMNNSTSKFAVVAGLLLSVAAYGMSPLTDGVNLMSLYPGIILIGLIATACMTAFLYLVHYLRIAEADMFTAIGSLVTPVLKNAFSLGLYIQIVAGMIFAALYLVGASYFGFHTGFDFLCFGAAVGLAHGVVFSLVMVILVAEHHPVERFRRVGFGVVAAHGLAHVIFGLSLGAAAAAIQPNLDALAVFGTWIS
jgi:hypothetical protein